MIDQAPLDALIVGGGIAGLTAANRLQQLGGRVVVLERGTEASYPCNSRFSGGVFHLCHKDMFSEPAVLREAIINNTNGFALPDLAQAVAEDGGRTVNWLREEGARFINLRLQIDLPYNGWVLAPPAILRAGPDWAGRGGDLLLQQLEKNLLKRGGKLMRGVRARTLLTSGGRVRGVECESANGDLRMEANAVLIADGGFQANLELLAEFVTKAPQRLQQRNARTGCGDGILMARAVGASMIGMKYFYGHLLSRDAMTNDFLWPKPQLDSLAMGGIVVTPDGRRFTDEGKGGVFMANVIAQLDDPLSAIAVFDEDVWSGPGGRSMLANVPANPILKEQGGTLHVADTIEALAAKAGLPSDTLVETVKAYNAALTDPDKLRQLQPQRSMNRYKPMPIAKAPFYAAPLSAGITYTMGGIVTDGFSRVLKNDGGHIPGLYAAGATTGGIEGGPGIGYVGGLSRSSTMGLRAAEHIGAELPQAHTTHTDGADF